MKTLLVLFVTMALNTAFALETPVAVPAPADVAQEAQGPNYNYVGAEYGRTPISSNKSEITTLTVAISKSISNRGVFFTGTIGSGSQTVTNTKSKAITAGIGFHAPIASVIDLVIQGELATGSVTVSSTDYSFNGTAIYLGIRGMITPLIEARLTFVSMNLTVNGNSSSDTQTIGQIGFNVSDSVQIFVAANSKSDMTTGLGVLLSF